MIEYAFLLLLFFVGIGFVAGMILVHFLVGKRTKITQAKLEPFECGSPAFHQPNERIFQVKYATVAILFVLFDLETILLYPWAIAARGTGSVAILAGFLFILMLTFALIYIWRKGLLNWR